MTKERYGFISVFAEHGELLGYVPHIYKSKLNYVRQWLTRQSYSYRDWKYFVLWIDGKKDCVVYR